MKPIPAIRTVELLAPARDYETGRSAIDFGADAIYVGGPRFGARQGAANAVDGVARLVAYARPFGVRVYAALNTLLFEEELTEAETIARELIAAGVDALIVQDMAFRRMALPGVELHASTQTCNTTPEGVRFLERCGFSRVILERGLTLEEIQAIRAGTTVSLECFVHGSICVGFSGQCYLSRSRSARSGNRGDCMQACRQSYDLVACSEDGAEQTILAEKHLLSLRDLNLSEELEALVEAGVDSFKIEGRLKDMSYIRNVVAHYRRQLDGIIAARNDLRRSSSGRTAPDFEPNPAKSFTRGFSQYVFKGKHRDSGEQLASFDTPKAIGLPVGKVARVEREAFEMDYRAAFLEKQQPGSSASCTDLAEVVARTLAPGDGICFLHGDILAGTNVNRTEGNMIWPNRMTGIVPGMTIYRNYDHRFTALVERSRTRRTISAEAHIEIVFDSGEEEEEGGICRLILTLRDEDGNRAIAERTGCFPHAENPLRMEDMFRTQLAKSGDTIFRIEKVTLSSGCLLFVAAALLNDLRREALDRLLQLRLACSPLRRYGTEERSSPYPVEQLGGEANVTNSLAAQFYRDHGVRKIEPGFDLRRDYSGVRVMTSSYCLRREIGACLIDSPATPNDPKMAAALFGKTLFLRHGGKRYRLRFDCAACRMHLYDE